MPGLKLTLQTTFTDRTLPILRDDPMLVPGALFLFDATHTLNPMPSGVPADTGTVPNLAESLARATIGGSDSLAGTLRYSGITTAGNSKGKIERTVKGGIHTILSQSVALGATEGMALEMPYAIRDWIIDNPDHQYYLSTWDRLTRTSKSPGTLRTADLSGGSSVLAYNLMSINGNGAQVGNGGAVGSRAAGAGYNGLGNALKNVAGANTAVSALNPGTLSARFGNAGGNNFNSAMNATGANATSHPSGVLYRMTFIDLTVAGWTYAQADKADSEAWAAAFDGRYADDTLRTNPSSIP